MTRTGASTERRGASRRLQEPPVSVRMVRTFPSVPAGPPGDLSLRGSPGPARLLWAVPHADEWQGLARHRASYPCPPSPSGRPDQELIEAIARAGLTGRGGAGFPTALKLRAVASGRAGRVLVANATEGEPASAKDRALACRLPHLVLDGALLAARAVDAGEVIVCVDRTNRPAAAALQRALAERAGREPCSELVRFALTPPRYVAGEETALVHWLNGGEAKPTLAPPRPFERGVKSRPTLVQNVETLAHIAQIAAFGDDWFRRAGTKGEPGTALLTVTVAPDRPVVLEAAMGTPGGALLEAAGAGQPEVAEAVLVGGHFGTWMKADQLALASWSREGLAPFGAHPGAGVLVSLPSYGCGLVETARILRWYAGESAGQCGPCVFGLPALAAAAAELAAGRAGTRDVARLRRWAADIEGRGACRHPDGAVRLLRSALLVFADDVDDHLRGRPCVGALRRVLPVPAAAKGWR